MMYFRHIESGKTVAAMRFNDNNTRMGLFAGSSRKFYELKRGDWVVKHGPGDYCAVTRPFFESQYESLV